MSEFSADNYFNNKLAESLPTPAGYDGGPKVSEDKYQELMRVSDEKSTILKAIADQKKANEGSLVSQLGLEPDSLAGQATNLAASAYSGVSRIVGNVAALPTDASSFADMASLSEEEIQAANRVKTGKAKPEDIALVSRKASMVSVNDTPEAKAIAQAQADANPNAPTKLELFDRAIKARETSRNINESFDRSSLVNTTKRDELNADLKKSFGSNWDDTKEGWDKLWKGDIADGSSQAISGLAGLIYGAGKAGITNPVATSEYVAENLPQLLVGAIPKAGAALLTATNIGYATDAFQKGMEEYASKNNGQMPSEETRQRMAMYAASAAVAEHALDVSILKSISPKSANNAVDAVVKASIKDTLGATAGAGLGEAITEGYQTFAEGEAGLKPATAEDIYVGAAIGGLTGAGMTGSLKAAGNAVQAVADGTAKLSEKRIENATVSEALEAAIASGDTSALTDKKNPAYAPDKAVAALYQNSQRDDATPETKQANYEKATDIVSKLEEERATIQESADELAPATITKYKDRIEKINEEIVDPANASRVDGLKEEASLLQEAIQDAEKNPKAYAETNARLAKVDARLTEARKVMDSFNAAQVQSIDPDTEIAAINNQDTKAADRLINLAMSVPERVDPKQALALADDTKNVLTTEQRTYLRAFSEARIAENQVKDLGEVSNDILNGSPKGSVNKYVGINQYRKTITDAIAAGNQKVAQRSLTALSNFATDHQNKASAAKQAIKSGLGNQIVKSGDQWIQPAQRLSDEAIRKSGGLTLNSLKLVNRIQTEATALNAAVSELKAVMVVKNAVKTPSVPGTETTVSVKPSTEASGVQTTEANGTVQATATPIPGTTTGSSAVEATGLTTKANDENTTEPSQVSATVPEVREEQAEQQQSTVNDTVNPDQAEVNQPNEVRKLNNAGKSHVYSQESTKDKPYQERNLLTDDTVQDAGEQGSATYRPLVATKDFISQVVAGTVKLKDFIKQEADLSDKQKDAIRLLVKKNKEWSKIITDGLVATTNPLYRFKDPMQFLIQQVDGKPQLEENVKTAISFAIMAYVYENSSATVTEKTINALLGRDSLHEVTDAEWAEFGTPMGYENAVRNTIGRKALQALGFKAKSSAEQDLIPRLESALGAHAEKVMLAQGLLEYKTVDAETMKAYRSGSEVASTDNVEAPTNYEQSNVFLGLARNDDGKLTDDVKALSDAQSGTANVLANLFSVESALIDPSLEPIGFDQKSPDDTNEGIPSRLKKAVSEKQNEKNYLSEDKWNLISHMDEDLALQMAGVVEVTEQGTHAANRKKIEAKNEGLRKELQRYKDFVQGVLAGSKESFASPFYFKYSIWKQQRVGIATNGLNPQMSKMHRYLTHKASWIAEIDVLDTDKFDSFKLRVLEGLGTKTDKQANSVSLPQFDQMFDEQSADKKQAEKAAILNRGIDALVSRSQGNDLSRTEQEAIAAAVKAGGEKYHSLDVLQGMAQYRQAKDGKFTATMMAEVDGVNNGPMLSFMLYGAAASVKDMYARLNKGGMFEIGNAHTQYNQYRGTAGVQDLYETTANDMTAEARLMIAKKPELSGVFSAIYGFTKPLVTEAGIATKEGRNIIKTPINAIHFGSATRRAVQGMAENFIESIYKRIEDVAAKPVELQAELTEGLIKDLNVLLNYSGQAPVPLNTSIKTLMEIEFGGKGKSLGSKEKIMSAFMQTLGKAAQETLKENFRDYLEKRDKFNQVSQMAYTVYNAAYQGMRAEYLNELVSDGSIATDKNGKPLHDLTRAQEAEFQKRIEALKPMLHTAMSKKDKDVKSGLMIAKRGQATSQEDTYTSEVKFANSIPGTPEVFQKSTGKYAGQKSFKTRGVATTMESPSVGMSSKSVHSFDSSISHETQIGNEILNVHDAVGTGLNNIYDIAQQINGHTWTELMNYSPLQEMYNSYTKLLTNLAEMNLSADTLARINSAVEAFVAADKKKKGEESYLTSGTVLETLAIEIQSLAYQADKMKFDAMSQMASMDQYAFEGGNYIVTDADRAEAKQRAEQLIKRIPKATADLIDGLNRKMTGQTDVAIDEVAETEAIEPKAKTSVWGELGTSTVNSNSELVQFFETNKNITAKQMIFKLNDMLKDKDDRISKVNRMLLSQVLKTVDLNLPITYVTPETLTEETIGQMSNVRGWYSVNGDKEGIYITGTAFKSSGVTVETVLHELIHASVAKTIANPSKAAQRLINDLNKLREEAKKIADNKFANALDNEQEFVAWGMTNQEFQREVLNKVSMKTSTSKNILVKGMKAFIDTVTGILFAGSAKTNLEIESNGLSILMANVSGLMAEAAKNKTQSELNLAMQDDPVGTVMKYSAQDIHSALKEGKVAPTFSDHLGNVLESIVTKLHGSMGTIHESLMSDQALTPLDVFAKALATGQLPVASSVAVSPLVVSQEESYVIDQVEATMAAALASGEAQTKLVYKELADLYNEARTAIPVSAFHKGDWSKATFTERVNAQTKHDFIFKPQSGSENRSTYLARFAALGLGHQEFHNLLQVQTSKVEQKISDGKTYADKIQILFEKVLEFFVSKVTHTFAGQSANAKLEALVGQLVDIEAKRRIALATRGTGFKYMKGAEDTAEQAMQKVRDAVVALTKTNTLQNSKVAVVRGANAVVRVVALQKVDTFMDAIQAVRDRMFDARQDIISDTIAQVRGPRELDEALLTAAKNEERERKSIITQQSKVSEQAFKDNGKNLTDQTKAAISAVMLRTGMHNLLSRFDTKQLEQLVSDKNALALAIQKTEAELNNINVAKDIQGFWINRANVLGKYRATGATNDKLLLMNAHNIARLFGTTRTKQVSESQARQAEEVIAALTSLYAIGYSGDIDSLNAIKVFKDENNRTDGNGVEFVLQLHKRLESEALERNFGGVKSLMIHGFLPEITNPQVDARMATLNEGKDLLDQGYVQGPQLPLDPNDPVAEPKYIFVMKGAGLSPYLSGAISLKNEGRKGTNADVSVVGLSPVDQAQARLNIANQRAKDIAAMFNTGARPDLSNVTANFMAPVLNESGDVVDYRYLMQESTKDALLDRNNDFSKLMGSLAGSIYDKESSKEQNRKVVKALFEEHRKDFATNSKSFVTISPQSPDPELRQIWNMLPDRTKADVRAIWGQDAMVVRNASLDIIFGYRKLSLATMFRKADEQRVLNRERKAAGLDAVDNLNGFETLVTGVVEHVLSMYASMHLNMNSADAERYSRRAAMVITKGERAWQEIIKEIKDIIVVKSGTVLLGNIWSNITLLALNGVSRKDMVQNQLVALKAATAYQKDSEELAKLKTQQEIGYSFAQNQDVKDRIVILEDALARNPVKSLIDKGMMPTIVEDLAGAEDIYSYKSALTRKVDKVSSKLNSKIVAGAKTVYMTHDGKLYQTLSRVTQLSDFVARYTLYQHLTTKDDPMSEQEALNEARDSFINYDLPMHRGLQYMDDMGFMMFTKYFLRIQRVLVKLSRDNPLRVFLTVALSHFIDLGPTVLDSTGISRIGNNPLTTGIFKFPGTLDDLGTIKGAESIMKMALK